MKTKILLLALAVFSAITLKSQIVITTCDNQPPYGDSVTGQVALCDTTGVTPGNFGAGITWDYSGLIIDSLIPYWHHFPDPASTPCYGTFPAANYADETGDGVYSYSDYSSDTAILLGNCMESLGCLEEYWNTQISLICPFSYQDSFSDTVYGYKCGSGVYTHLYKIRHTTYDAYGTLILPNGTYNAYRFKEVEYRIDSVFMDGGAFLYSYEVNITDYVWMNTDETEPERAFLMYYMSGTSLGIPFKQVSFLYSFDEQNPVNPLDSGLVAYYPFNGNANDESGNGYNGSAMNGASLTTDRFGNINKAYSFDGTDDYINITAASGFSQYNDPQEQFTISAWFKTNVATSAQCIYSNSSEDGWHVVAVTTNNAAFWITNTSWSGTTVTGSDAVNDNSWHQVTCIFDNPAMNLYVDGILEGTVNFTGTLLSSGGWPNGGIKIGVRYLLDGGYFNGSLDDIRIYNRALSEAEIQALYDTIPTLAPVADFTVNDSTVTAGSTVQFTDLSTNNPISWSWSFAGGTPSSSTLQNPSVTYNTAGTYDVTLIVANAAGSDTLTKTNYIEVNDTVPMVTFQKSYGTDGYEYGNTVHRTTDNGYIINGCTSASYANYYQNYVLKTDNSGTMLWSIKFGNIYSSNYRVVKNIIQTSDGGYIVAGSDCSTGVWFSKINSSGNIVWSKLFGGLCYPKQIINTPDGNYMIVSDNSITKIDTAFNILWAKSYNTPDYFFMNSVIPTNDNGYIVVASDYYGGAGQIDISLLKIDSSGNPLWAKSYGGSDDEYGSYIVQTSDNGYLISGTTRSFGGWDETYLVRIDSIGNVVWSKIIDNTTASGSYNSMVPIIKTTDGNFLVGTTFPNSTYPSYDACFVKIDQAGNILWKNAFGKHVLNYHETITSIEELSSGGFAAGGFTNFLELIKDDLYLAVLNDIGKVGCNDYEPNIFMVNTSTISSAITPTSANISLSVSPLTVVPSVPTTTETNTCVIIAEANFIANDSTIMTGSTIQFTDLSPNSPTTWNWSFPGGTPSSSTLQNPSITYNTAGTYNVTLIVTNTAGSDTLTKNNYINVTPASNDYNISQGGTVITCSGNFIGDPGTSYAPDSYYIMTFCADTTENEQIQFDFTSMGLAGTDCGICYGDDIYVYDGADIYAPELGLFGMSCGDYETYWWWSSCPISIIRSTNGCLTFKFITTDHFCLVGENTGWTASISCVPSYPIIPDFSFISACAVDTNYFTDLSQNATSWEWNFGNGQTSTLQNPICIYYSTGTFTVTLTINGCYTITKQVTISDAPPVANITAGGPTTFCNGDSVVLNANSCIGCSYLWNTGETTQSITAWQSGLYNVTATNSCGSDEATPEFVSVNYTPVPTISTNGATEFCDGDSVILTATTADSYLWSTGETSQSIVVYTSGDYYVAITDDCGSESSQATTIVVHFLLTAPVITAGGTTTFCQGNYVTLTSDVADYYYWSTGANTQSIDVYNSGDYYVTITNSNGCQAVSAVETVIVNPNPATPVITPSGATIFCDGESVTLSCSTADDYLWNTGETSQSITVDSTGTFSVTVTNTNGCTAESGNIYTSEISAPLAPVISSVGSAIVCQGESVVLYSTSANDFLWSNGETTQYITVTDAGDYTVTVTYSCGTSVSDAFTVTVNPNPAVPVITPSGTVSICTGDFLALNCSTADYYYWSTGAITQSIDVYSAGDYSVTITDINGCTAASVSTSIEVTDPLNSFSASATVFYLPDATVDFSSVVNGPIASYLWDFGDGGTSAAANPSYTYADPGLYTVSLTVDDGNGCIETVTLTNYIWIEQVFTTTTINTGTTDNLSGVYFTSPDYGVLTTTTGNVLITDDGGSNWTTSSNTGIQYITGVSVYNGSVYISGPWGYIGVSYNNGLNWYDYNLMTNAIFNGLYFTSAGAGYAVGTEGTVYNFNGASWLAQTISTSYDFMAVYGWGDYAWAVGDYGTIWGYDGISWNAFNSGVTYNLTGVNFVNDLVGYATGATGAILSTIDGGATWNQVFDGVALGCSFTCITGANADTLWAIGDGGIVYQTLDAGLTWSRFSIGSYLDLAAIQYADGVGHIAGKDGKLYEFGSPTTTVKQTETENKIRIYPNPATSSITIEITTDTRPDYSFTMYDMLGKKVLQIEIHNSRTEVQINNLQAGLYYYNIAGGNKIIKTGKIVIQ